MLDRKLSEREIEISTLFYELMQPHFHYKDLHYCRFKYERLFHRSFVFQKGKEEKSKQVSLEQERSGHSRQLSFQRPGSFSTFMINIFIINFFHLTREKI